MNRRMGLPLAQIVGNFVTMLEVWVPGTGYSENHDTAVLSYCPSAVSDEVANSVIETFRVQLTEVAEA
ncbi:hypothetical protein [Frankia sp. Cppng1_Ct_nod]|uniref:hypothetical protein n=1 Tax=Frankia sp. Cppng1_Ct_nod TaxID=2897162 RepID=UPI001041577F|nr:hypothetical protein [Frankia sp. Cppng1_Ct_nod]